MRIIITIGFILCFLHTKAQQQSIGLDFGLTFPTGKLGESDYNDSTTGYGQYAGNFKINYQKLNAKNIGFYAEYANHAVNYDSEKQRADINNDFKSTGLAVNAYSVKRYNIKGLNFGFAGAMVKEKFGLYANIGTGIVQCRSIDYSYTLSDGADNLKLNYDADIQTTFNFNAKVFAAFNIGKHFQYTIGGGCQFQTANFENDYKLYFNNTELEKGTIKTKQPMNILNFNMGLRYVFGKS